MPAVQTTHSSAQKAPFYKGSSWILGSLLEMEKDPAAFMERLLQSYDDVVRFRLATESVHLCIHPEAISHVLHDNHMNYDKQVFDYKMMGSRLLGKGLLTNDGPSWLKQRRLSQPAFSHKRINAYSSIMQRCTEDFLKEWQQKDGQELDMSVEMAALTLRIVGLTLFGKDLIHESAEIGHALSDANQMLTRRLFSGIPDFVRFMPLDFKLKKAANQLRNVVDEIIEERKGHEEDYDDLLSILMMARDENDRGMDPVQMRDEVLTLLLAGHETTANALTCALHLLSLHPEEQEHLSSECRTVCQGQVPDFQKIKELEAANRVVQETMRLYPPAWSIARRCKKDDEIMGYPIKSNSLVFLSQLVTHRHPDFWERPELFRPARFSADEIKSRHQYAFFPFGGGPRLCIGADFAMMEAVIILSSLMMEFRVEPLREKVDMELLITLRPKDGLPLRIQRRSV